MNTISQTHFTHLLSSLINEHIALRKNKSKIRYECIESTVAEMSELLIYDGKNKVEDCASALVHTAFQICFDHGVDYDKVVRKINKRYFP